MIIKFKDIKTFIFDFKNVLVAVISVVAIIISFFAIFARAEDLKKLDNRFYKHELYQRLDYLERSITNYEVIHKCVDSSCIGIMDPIAYKTYREKQSEKERIKTEMSTNTK